MNYLAITHTYHSIELLLTHNNRANGYLSIPKTEASRALVVQIQKLLQDNQLSLQNLKYIAVNQGPGPFTTLRVVIATVNGISFAIAIPLIGIDGLDALLYETQHLNKPTIALLNAFNNDVYFGIATTGGTPKKGYKNIENFLKELKTQDAVINFVGNGAQLHKELIEKTLGPIAQFPTAPSHYNVETIGKLSALNWKIKKNILSEVQPLYLKQAKAS